MMWEEEFLLPTTPMKSRKSIYGNCSDLGATFFVVAVIVPWNNESYDETE